MTSIAGTTNEKLNDVIINIKDTFKFCEESGLTIEVMATAMILLKENPNYNIEYIIWEAMKDWDI